MNIWGDGCLKLNPDAPEVFKKEMGIGNDGTICGFRVMACKNGRFGVSTSEINATYNTVYGDKEGKGLHKLLKEKVCGRVHGEPDRNVVGEQKGLHLSGYMFMHRVHGQTKATEYVLHPEQGGFFKRFDLFMRPEKCF